ncbi:MAG: hypothetical protein HQK87_08635 [Nitrospinae bacterium]|nr:hypothetical protein [Nitrospinota bacterium]
MDTWITWAGIGFAIAVAWFLRERREEPPVRHAPDRTLAGAKGEPLFDSGRFVVRVAALEFDDGGPVLYVNGEFANDADPLEVEETEALVRCGGEEREMIGYDPDDEGRLPDTRNATLVDFTGPVTLAPGERGLFRIPLCDPDAGERLADILDFLDRAADELIDRFDREFGEYTLDEEFLEEMTDRLLADRAVAGIGARINDELFYRTGPVAVTLKLYGPGGDPVDEVRLRFDLTDEEMAELAANVGVVIANSLRGGLEAPLLPYRPVVIEADRLRVG